MGGGCVAAGFPVEGESVPRGRRESECGLSVDVKQGIKLTYASKIEPSLQKVQETGMKREKLEQISPKSKGEGKVSE